MEFGQDEMTTVVSLEVAKVVNRMAKNNSTTRINITGGDHRRKTIRGKPRRTLGERDHVSLLKTHIIQREMTNPLQDGQALVFIPQATDVEGHSRNNHGDKYMRVIEHCHIILVKTKISPAPSSAKLPRWGQEQFFSLTEPQKWRQRARQPAWTTASAELSSTLLSSSELYVFLSSVVITTTKAPVLRLCVVEVYAYSYCKNHSLNLLFLEKKRENLVERDKMRENEKGQN